MSTSFRSSHNPFKADPAPRAARAAVALAAALGIVACATTDKRTEAEKAADSSLAKQVREALHADSNLYAEHIQVDARGGVVWLTGFVDSDSQSTLASSDSQAVPGVRRVIDQIEIGDLMPNF